MSAAVKPEIRTGEATNKFAPVIRQTEPIIAGTFTRNDSIGEMLAAATALERIGYEPKLKFAGNGDDPEFIQLVVDDVADIMTKLRASLTPTPTKEASNRGTPKVASLEGRGASEL